MRGRKPRIFVALDNKKEEYQSPIIEVEVKIDNQLIEILIDYGASHSFLKYNIFEIFHLKRSKHKKYWLAQLTTRDKRKVNEYLKIVQ